MTLRGVVKQAAALFLPEPLMVLRGSIHGKRIALTFDDGPDDMTPAYLRLFDRLGMRATFFLIGDHVVRHRRHVLDLVAAGHEVLGHSYSHTKFTLMSADRMRREIQSTTAVLPLARRKALRPPGGAFSASTLIRTALLGYSTILWSHDSKDASERDPAGVSANLEQSRNGDIVLLHEGQPWTLAALEQAVPRLRDRGFELVTVGELLGW